MTTFTVTVDFGVTVVDATAIAARRLQRRRTPRATAERHLNYMLKRSEPGQEKAGFYREQVPGLSFLQTLAGPIRGLYYADTRLFVVAGSGLYELDSAFAATQVGTLSTSGGWVDMAHGLFSLVIVDGPYGYDFDLANNVLNPITADGFYGSARVSYFDTKFVFVRPNSQQFYWTYNPDDAQTFDANEYMSAFQSPDKIIAHLVDHRELWFFGASSIEVFSPYPNGDQVYARNNGAAIEVGCAAAMTPQKIDNTIYWVGYDKLGQGIVWSAGGSSGYTPMRISTQDLEDEVSKLGDISDAYAWTYQDAGQTFYCLQIPGLETTWVYDASVQKWHERSDFEGGEVVPFRGDCHAFAFGKHVIGDANGNLYELDPYEYTLDGDTIYREWTSPHASSPKRNRVFYHSLRLDITVGETDSGTDPMIEMCYSNDGGNEWSAWKPRSTGRIGRYSQQVVWNRLGHGRDRLWKFRCADNCKVSILGMSIEATEGRS